MALLEITAGESVPLAAFFGVSATALAVCFLLAWTYVGKVQRNETLSPVTTLAATLAIGGVIVGASVDVLALELETIRAATATFVALAAASFVYDAGRYGRTLAREVGSEASRRAQLVRLGWSGAVAVVGVPVAAVGLVGTTVLAPTLSVPATAGVVAAVTAIAAGAWLLLR